MRELFRDERSLAQVLRRKLLRSLIRAVGVLDHACGGRGRIPEAETINAARTLARLIPRFVIAPHEDPQQTAFDEPEWWTVEKLLCLENMASEACESPYPSREHAAQVWRTCFDKNGPREGLFETREQAAEYGRQRYDQWKPAYEQEEEYNHVL